MKGTFAEFETQLNAIECEEGSSAQLLAYHFDGYADDLGDEPADAIEKLVGEFEVVDSYGGEGQGETWYVVANLKDWGFFIRIDAHYQSYDGVDYGEADISEVKPKTITKTVYE